MKKLKDGHLLEEQIIRAVVDEKELSEEGQNHLVECRQCLRRVEQFKARMQEFGARAELFVPPLTKTMRLPQAEPLKTKYGSRWIPFAGAVAMAGIVLFFYFLGMDAMSPQMATVQSTEKLLEDEYLMREISDMVENPLPDDLYEITGDAAGFDDEFLQFVVPDFQEDFQS